MTSPYLFEIIAGDDYALDITIKDKDSNAVDISEYMFQATLKLDPRVGDEHAAVKVDTPPVDGKTGRVVINLPHGQTQELVAGAYYFDTQMVNIRTGHTATFVKGRVKVLTQVTHRNYADEVTL